MAKAKRSRVSIRFKTLSLLGVFVLVMIGLLWLFQIVLLDDFYISIKKRGIASAFKQAQAALILDDCQSALDEIALNSDVCINILDENGHVVYEKHVTPQCIIHNMRSDKLIEYYVSHVATSGDMLEGVFDRGHMEGVPLQVPQNSVAPQASAAPSIETIDDTQWHDRTFKFSMRANNDVQSMICMKTIQMPQAGEVLLMVNSSLTPVNATVETLRQQLMLITLLLMVLAIALALYLSNKFSRPIIAINDEAKKLAQGSFDAHFKGTDYLEAAELADTLNYAATELSKTDDLRRELMANISHDLRTPLTMIEGFAEMMRDLPSENNAENAQVIIDEARYLSTLVCDILDLSRLEAGAQPVDLQPMPLTQMLRGMLKRYERLSGLEGYTLRLEADDEVCVTADELRIQQVVYNLINNAISYTGPDKLVRVRQTTTNAAVRIEVIDSGKGIDAQELPFIWDRYYKADRKSHRRALVGTGLGLSIVKKVLTAHGANFGVNSCPDGSTFWFELPLTGDDCAPSPPQP